MGTAILLSIVLADLGVSGGATCPTPAEVSARLRTMLPERGTSGGHATIDSTPDGLKIELRDGAGAVVATKHLSGSARCSDLASVAALVLASWVAELDSGPMLDSVALLPLPAPSQPALPPTGRWGFEVGAGVSGSWAGGSLSLGALVDASITPGGTGLGGQLSLAALGSRDLRLPEGRITWQRYALGLGAHERLKVSGGWRVDLQAGFLAALLAVTTDDPLGPAGSSTHFDPGFGAGARVLGPPGLWLGLSSNLWPLPQRTISGANLPQLEVILAIGASVGPE